MHEIFLKKGLYDSDSLFRLFFLAFIILFVDSQSSFKTVAAPQNQRFSHLSSQRMQSFWKYVLTVAALAVSLAMAASTQANPHMQQHRKLGALNRGASGLSRTIL